MELSQKLKRLRKERRLSQLELSEELDVSRQAVSAWEAGASRPSTDSLRRLSGLYGVPLEYLLDDGTDGPKGAAEPPGPEPKPLPEPKPKWKRRAALALVLIAAAAALMAGAFLCGRARRGQMHFHIENLPGEEVEVNPQGDFDIEW